MQKCFISPAQLFKIFKITADLNKQKKEISFNILALELLLKKKKEIERGEEVTRQF